ncbi:MAG: hypothetical protein KDI13_06100 [Alphaproteobacteria bacterium]|nr:hypothetical protein [Alphaproteobacteria bacterium]
MERPNLLLVRLWAQNMLHGGEVNPPPWEWYQYMKLIEAIDALENGMQIPINQISISTANSPQLEQRQERHPRLEVVTCLQDISQSHPESGSEE